MNNARRSAPAAARNVLPIGDVLADWLPESGTVLELASGSGEHALAFARRFPALDWQPSDAAPDALGSIAAWREEGPANLLAPLRIDAARPEWGIGAVAAIVAVTSFTSRRGRRRSACSTARRAGLRRARR